MRQAGQSAIGFPMLVLVMTVLLQDADRASVTARCRVAGDVLRDCAVVSESHPGLYFSASALGRMEGRRLDAFGPDVQVVDGTATLEMSFPRRPTVRPDGPAAVILDCAIDARRRVENCRVISESHPNAGFAEAALKELTRQGRADAAPRSRAQFTFTFQMLPE